jgi:hypothetical protein
MAFGNPIIGGDDTLVRNAIQSEGFASGSSGWRIERSGDAEFNGITARGSVILDGESTLLVYDADDVLIVSISPEGGTDSGGQTYEKGIDTYDTHNGIRTYEINTRDGVIIFNFKQSNVFLQRGLLQANEPLDASISPSLGMYAPSDNADQLQGAVVCYGTSQDATDTHRVRITGVDPLDNNAPIATLLDLNGDLEASGSVTAENIKTGTVSVSFATSTSHIRSVSIPAMPAAPKIVLAVISSGAGVSTGWTIRTDSYTTTSFRLLLAGPSAAWSGVDVNWLAIS